MQLDIAFDKTRQTNGKYPKFMAHSALKVFKHFGVGRNQLQFKPGKPVKYMCVCVLECGGDTHLWRNLSAERKQVNMKNVR